MTWIRTRAIFFGLGLAMVCQAQDIRPDAPVSGTPSSREVLAKVAEVYRNLDTYQDEGLAVTAFELPAGGHTTERPFRTAFARSGRFRFEFFERGQSRLENRYVIWMDGPEVRSWWTIRPQVERHEDLGAALAGATGVSGGTAETIPSLLLKEAAWGGFTWTSVTDAYRIADSLEGSQACFRIQRLTATEAKRVGTWDLPATRGKMTYWISKAQFLLLRIEGETAFDTFRTKATTRYLPITNAPIPDAAFEFGH